MDFSIVRAIVVYWLHLPLNGIATIVALAVAVKIIEFVVIALIAGSYFIGSSEANLIYGPDNYKDPALAQALAPLLAY